LTKIFGTWINTIYSVQISAN